MEHLGDITALNGGELVPVNIITFGSPCQSFSIAGQRKGLEGKSGLFWEAIRIIREMREATKNEWPQYCVFENVPGILSANRGLDYKTVLEAFAETEIPMPAYGRWTNAGMVRGRGTDIAWVIHDAQYFGVAQRRRRLFLVCHFTGQRAAEILFKPKSLHGYFTQGGAEGKRTSPNASGSSGSAEQRVANGLNQWDTKQEQVFKDEREPTTLAGAEGGETPGGLAAAFMGGQSGLARSIAYNEEISPTLKAGAGGNMVPCVCEPKLARTLTARGDSSPCFDRGQNIIVVDTIKEPTVYPINTQVATRHNALGKGTGFGIGNDGDPAYTLQEAHNHAVAVLGINQNADGDVRTAETAYAPLICHPEIAGTLCASGAGLSRPAGMCNETDLCIVTETPPDPNPPVCGTLCAKSIAPNGIGNEADMCVLQQPHIFTHLGFGHFAESDKSKTILQCDKPGTSDVVAYCLQGNMIGRQDKNGPQGSGINEEVAFTLGHADRHAVAAVDCRNFNETEELSGTLQAKSGSGGYSLNYQNPVRNCFIVRRLTPIECERLQGYPDFWTEYGHDGKPLSDTARYQALGNSVAIPCVAYVLSGIADEFYSGDPQKRDFL